MQKEVPRCGAGVTLCVRCGGFVVKGEVHAVKVFILRSEFMGDVKIWEER
jgi:hypothetical protein